MDKEELFSYHNFSLNVLRDMMDDSNIDWEEISRIMYCGHNGFMKEVGGDRIICASCGCTQEEINNIEKFLTVSNG
jgi:hypothetical protein